MPARPGAAGRGCARRGSRRTGLAPSSSGLISGPPTASGSSVMVGAGTTSHMATKKVRAARARTNQVTPEEYPPKRRRGTVSRYDLGTVLASPLLLIAGLFGLLGGILVIAGLVALRRRRPFRFVIRTAPGHVAACPGRARRRDRHRHAGLPRADPRRPGRPHCRAADWAAVVLGDRPHSRPRRIQLLRTGRRRASTWTPTS